MDKKPEPKDQLHAIRRHGCIIGIDAGLSGGIAVYDPTKAQLVTAWDMPVHKEIVDRKNKITLDDEKLDSQLADACKEYGVALICVEKVQSSPQMGVASAFKFGMTYGMTVRVARNNCLRVELVSPIRWKPRMMVSADKKTSLALARRLWGMTYFAKEKDDGKAEAAILAKYAANEFLYDFVEEEVDPLS